ncbi:MAG: S41 family peptidase [Phycisphaerales bacterium]
MRPRFAVSCLLALMLAPTSHAQQGERELPTVDAAFRRDTIEHLAKVMDERYVSRETAEKVAQELRAKNESGAYDGATSPLAFADALTRDLQTLAGDRHLRMRFSPGQAASEGERTGPTPEEIARFTDRMRSRNYAFERVEILEGNVGYLKFDGFMDFNDEAYRTASSAMGFLANADAVIFDLRTNGGGSPSMVQFLCTYLFPKDEPVHLNSIYDREGDITQQYWTLPHVPGERLADVPVYVLTSRRTFSGAEEFCYNLQTRKRGTIVGETTGGGANPGGTVRIDTNFEAFIPGGRAINPITNTNWEGVGVKPDVECPADNALTTAHSLAVGKLLETTKDEDRVRALQWSKGALDAAAHPVTMNVSQLEPLAGTFGERRTWMEGGVLKYQRLDSPARTLTPMSGELFSMEGTPYARVRIEKGTDGKAARLVVVYDDGREDVSERTK